MKKQIRIVNAALALFLALFFTAAILLKVADKPERELQQEPQQIEPATVSFYAVGDSPDAQKDVETYRYIKETIQSADVAVINQATVVNDYAPTLADIGFDAANIAPDHMPQDKDAWINHLKSFADSSIVTSGAFLNKADQNDVRIIEKSGIKFSFIGIGKAPDSDELFVNTIENEDAVRDRIEQAKKQSDFVVLMANWDTADAANAAQKLADWGADIIIGQAQSTVQPIERLTCADGRTIYVAYSLGSFACTQNAVGAGLSFNVTRHADGTLTVDDLYTEPLITDICVYKFSDYHSPQAIDNGWSLQTIADNFQKVMGDYARIVNSEL